MRRELTGQVCHNLGPGILAKISGIRIRNDTTYFGPPPGQPPGQGDNLPSGAGNSLYPVSNVLRWKA